MKYVTFLFTLCVIAILPNSCLLADEIYKDKDGVWRNRQTLEEKSTKALSEGIVGFGEAFSDIAREAMFPQFESLERSRKENETIKNRQRIKEFKERQENEPDFTGYEKFDPTKAGEVKSEWEYFDDPRSKK